MTAEENVEVINNLWCANVQVQPDCEGEDNEEAECAPVSVSWEGSAEMQSGDILLVRIDDTRLVDSTAPRRPMSVVDR